MKAKTFGMGLLAALLTLTANAETVKGNGKIVTKDMDIHPYEAVKIDMSLTNNNGSWKRLFQSGNAPVETHFNYRVDDKTTLQITIDENLYELLEVKVDDKTLLIKARKDYELAPTKFDLKGSSERLTSVDLSGNTIFTIESDLRDDRFAADLSTGCQLRSEKKLHAKECVIDASTGCVVNLSGMDCERLAVDASTGCTLELGGKAKVTSLDASTGSTVNAAKLQTETTNCDASTGSSISVHATLALNADATLGSTVKYTGDPITKIDTSLGGSVERE